MVNQGAKERQRPRITVSLITYNHEKYIAKAIESVLSQTGGFDLNLLIGVDASTDKTAEVVAEYVKKYPDIISATYNSPENKFFIDGKPTGNMNFMSNLLRATGEYVALLDGDDYWIDTNKLEKQISFLEKNKAYSACCHAAILVDKDGKLLDGEIGHTVDGSYKDFELFDVIEKNPVPALSLVFRNPFFRSFPSWISKMKMADWPLHIINAKRGSLRYINEPMAAYRIHGGGLWAAYRNDSALELKERMRLWQTLLEFEDFLDIKPELIRCLDCGFRKLIKRANRKQMFDEGFRLQKERKAVLGLWPDGFFLAMQTKMAFRLVMDKIRLGKKNGYH